MGRKYPSDVAEKRRAKRSEKAELRAQLTSPGGWGQVGSAREHERYAKQVVDRRRCPWCPKGHRKRVTHVGMANGVALTSGCEWHVARWVRNPNDCHPETVTPPT